MKKKCECGSFYSCRANINKLICDQCILDLYRQGDSYSVIAKKSGIKDIPSFLARRKEPRTRAIKTVSVCKKNWDSLIIDYTKNKLPIKIICQKYDICRDRVYAILAQNGVKANRKYQ